MATASALRNRYARESVATASPARLVTMLYDRLVHDLLVAETALGEGRLHDVNIALVHAQAIVAELQVGLDVDAWDGGPGLADLYRWLLSELVSANVSKDAGRIRDCVEVVEPLRDAWHEAARALPAVS